MEKEKPKVRGRKRVLRSDERSIIADHCFE
jgi:hypothetical protein